MAPMIASIPSPPFDSFDVGPFTLHMYGICYIVAIAAAIGLTARRWGSSDLVVDVALWGVPAGLIGARIYSVATSWDQVVPDHWWGPFAIWEGGLSIWGGIAGGALVGAWRLRRAGVDIPRFMDAVAPGLLIAQAIGRVGNYFNQELFGEPTTLPWGLEIAPEHRPAEYLDVATFHPMFLYEGLFTAALAGVLILVGRSGRVRSPGLFALYVAGYSGFRVVAELGRTDPSHHVLGLRLNFFVAVVLTVAGLVAFVVIQRWRPRLSAAALLLAGAATIGVAACGEETATAAKPTAPTAISAPTSSVSTADAASTHRMLLPGLTSPASRAPR